MDEWFIVFDWSYLLLAYRSENSLRINYCAQNVERLLICSIYDAAADECSLSAAAAIRKKRLGDFYPLEPHYYIVKLGFAGVFQISLFLL